MDTKPNNHNGQIEIGILDPIDQGAIDILMERYNVSVAHGLSGGRLTDFIANKHVIILRSGVKITANDIAAAQQLDLIIRAGVGMDNIDVEAAIARNITVLNIPRVSSNSVAEHTVALMLCLLRNICLAHSNLKNNFWSKQAYLGTEVAGKTIGIVGLGMIGQSVAEKAIALGMNVVGCVWRINDLKEQRLREMGVEVMDLDSVIRRADILSLHVPLNRHTRDMIDRSAIAMMKPGAYMINMSRGGVVVEDDLYDALKQRQIAGAASDVFINEGQFNRLFELDNFVQTPHIGASTRESQQEIGARVVRMIAEHFGDESVLLKRQNTCV